MSAMDIDALESAMDTYEDRIDDLTVSLVYLSLLTAEELHDTTCSCAAHESIENTITTKPHLVDSIVGYVFSSGLEKIPPVCKALRNYGRVGMTSEQSYEIHMIIDSLKSRRASIARGAAESQVLHETSSVSCPANLIPDLSQIGYDKLAAKATG